MSKLLHCITGVNRVTLGRATLLFALMAGMLVLVGQEFARLQAQGSDKAAAFSPQQVAFFEKQVQPLLRQHCWKCHGDDPGKLRGGLDLRTRHAILQGGDSGPAVDLRQPDKSLLLQAVHYKDEHIRMPPKGKLSEAEIAILEKWVKDGLPVPADRLGGGVARSPGGHDAEEAKKYWAYQPVRRPAIPAVRNTSWVRTPIDAFILARLEERGLHPVAPADKVTLIRRAYFDLLGLPPTPEQIDAFVQDTSPQ
ncbi:MAG: DUF1549 domain-containing protein, partial [Thermogemmata sp.]